MIFNELCVHIRWMIRRDMPEVFAIERASFEHPWSEERFYEVLRRRNCIGMVAEHGERVVGFMVYELHGFGIEVLDFAVHPESRRCGVGRRMIEKLRDKLGGKRWRLGFTLRESWIDGCLFLRAMGIEAKSIYREEFPDTGEDAYRFTWGKRTPCDAVGVEA